MLDTNSTYEYTYTTAEVGHHHDYLLPPLLKLLSTVQQNKTKKLRVLDVGCGNGSLSYSISKLGYEVVGIEDSPSGVAAASKSFPECKFIHASVYSLPSQRIGRGTKEKMCFKVFDICSKFIKIWVVLNK